MKNGPKKTGTQKNKQMTKESILNKIDEPDNNLIFDGDNRMIGYDGDVRPILRAMDEYAKQQAIAFIRHCLEAGYLRPDEDGSVQLDYNYWYESNFTKASEEIYTKFIEQQNKE